MPDPIGHLIISNEEAVDGEISMFPESIRDRLWK
jgi:hypothetical protein